MVVWWSFATFFNVLRKPFKISWNVVKMRKLRRAASVGRRGSPPPSLWRTFALSLIYDPLMPPNIIPPTISYNVLSCSYNSLQNSTLGIISTQAMSHNLLSTTYNTYATSNIITLYQKQAWKNTLSLVLSMQVPQLTVWQYMKFHKTQGTP